MYPPSLHLLYMALSISKCLPTGIKDLSNNFESFKYALKKLGLENSFYTSQEYFNWAASNK